MRWTLMAVAALGACGSQPDEAAQPKQTISVRSPEQDRLHKLNELDRAIALKRAIYASGYTCRRVESSGYVGQYRNLDMWTAACGDRRQWAIYVGADDSVQVRDCRDVEKLDLLKCEIKNSEPANAG